MKRIILNETSYYGAGCRTAIADEIQKRGFKKVLLVTDKDLIKFGVAAKIEEVLTSAGIPYEIYSEIKPNPTIKNVLDGLAAFKASGADCMVALGGGSSIDTAKAIGIINNNPEFADVRSLEGVAPTKNKAVPKHQAKIKLVLQTLPLQAAKPKNLQIALARVRQRL